MAVRFSNALCTFNRGMCGMLPWELRCVLGRNGSESGIIIVYMQCPRTGLPGSDAI